MRNPIKTQVQYVVVTPARNEEENIRYTIQSMVAQTRRPLRWVIVDDGSTDQTRRIIDEAAREHSWISTLHRPDRGARKQGRVGESIRSTREQFRVSVYLS